MSAEGLEGTPPPQKQDHQPGRRDKMQPEPKSVPDNYKPAGKLEGRTALVTGGDSGIGRAVSILFAKEGADVAIAYLEEDADAEQTARLVEQTGRKCLLHRIDVGDSKACSDAVEQTVSEFGRLDVLVNNAAEQHPVGSLEELTDEQLHRTFRSNIFSCFYMTRAGLKHLPDDGSIICTPSVTAYQGHKSLVDYASTKGAIVAFVRSLSQALAEKGIRVNGVAPGPIWTPLIPASFSKEKVEKFGKSTAMGRPGQPEEVAPCYVFLASDDASRFTRQVLHPNGGRHVNG